MFVSFTKEVSFPLIVSSNVDFRFEEVIERFSRHFEDKIAKLRSIVSCPAQRSLKVTSSPSTIGISKSFRCCCARNRQSPYTVWRHRYSFQVVQNLHSRTLPKGCYLIHRI